MHYQKIYNQIIQKAKSQNRQKRKFSDKDYTYYEAHHMVPKCLGGEGSTQQWKFHENIVLLTAREHFLCHKLLCEIYHDNKNILYSFWGMCNQISKKQQRCIVNTKSKSYEYYKKQFIDNCLRGENNPSKLESTRKKVNEFWTAEKRLLQKKLSINKTIKEYICPHCQHFGKGQTMFMWHFNNCIFKSGNENKKRSQNLSEENKQKLVDKLTGNTYRRGKKASLETIEKLKGKVPWNKGLIGIVKSPIKGKKINKETRKFE